MKPLKSIYKRRSRYGWLILEIIVASILAFFVLDSIIVSFYDAHRPYNYDVDRLVLVQLRTLDHHDPRFDPKRIKKTEDVESYMLGVLPRFTQLPEVEAAQPLPERGFGGGADSYEQIALGDTTAVTSFRATFIPGTEFFTTLGFKAASDIPGNPTTEQMNDMEVNFSNEMICTRSMARLLHGDEYQAFEISRQKNQARTASHIWSAKGTDSLKIVGIIEDARAWGDRPWPLIRFYSDPLSHSITWNNTNLYNILLKVKPGQSAADLANRLNKDPELRELGRIGQLEFDNARTYDKVNGADSLLSPKERYRNILVFFFAANIFLGVFGTFWLLTRKRTEEAGIMRAFGATPRKVRLMLYAEGAIIALGASLIGCAIYIFFLYHNPQKMEYGLSGFKDIPMEELPPVLHSWVGDFWVHTGIVTAVVCLTMLLVVLAGIAIPAWRLSKINPVEALSDE